LNRKKLIFQKRLVETTNKYYFSSY